MNSGAMSPQSIAAKCSTSSYSTVRSFVIAYEQSFVMDR